MAKISILVPVYNVERYIGACLDSILGQTYTDFEIICMDDGSTDSSGMILDRYATKDARIRVIHKENSGYGNTMNEAVRAANGKYIGIVESDDSIEPDMFQVYYDTMIQYDLDMVKSDFYMVRGSEEEMKKKYVALTDNEMMYNRVIDPNQELGSYFLEKYTWNALYKKELLTENNIKYNETPGASYQDNGFWFQTFYWAKRVMFLNRPFYNYRIDNEGASAFSKQKVYAMKNEFDFIREFMISHHEKREEMYKICFHLRMLAYLSTLERIATYLKIGFAKSIVEECKYYEGLGEACYDWFSEKQMLIIKSPERYVDEEKIGYKEIGKAILGFPVILIYGAGKCGERIICRVKQSKTDTQMIKVAVTSLNGGNMQCQGEEVCEIADCVIDKEKCLVILAVKENTETYCEMLENLRKLQFHNIISISAKRL